MQVVTESHADGSKKHSFWEVFYHREIIMVAVVNDFSEVDASFGFQGDWAAYIGTVPGYCHKHEWPLVADHGEKLSEAHARQFFDGWDAIGDLPYRP